MLPLQGIDPWSHMLWASPKETEEGVTEKSDRPDVGASNGS